MNIGAEMFNFLEDFRSQLRNALAAGTLLHIGLVELLPEDFREGKDWHNKPPRLASLLALFVGGAIMAVLAVWA